ncbi:MAG: insulinase family protein [Alicyclobacillus sp.]|nr:insulinase family protein [Alicyclobacillus sp.]
MSYKVRLSNGIRVVGEEIPNLRSVSIGIWIATGSRYETPQNNGISHFLEHMLFKGTERYSARELAEVFDGIGGQVNAFTSKEYTCFYAKVLDEHFDLALGTLADMFLHSTFASDEMDKEKRVVIEEIHMYEDTPDELVMDVLAEHVYGNHPLGYTILGLEDNLRRFSREQLQQHVREHYLPDSVVVSVAGNIPQARAVEAVERLFGVYRAPSGAMTPALVRPGFQPGIRIREKDIEQVHVCLASNGLAAGDPDLYALVLLNNALGSSSSSRLFQEIREARGLAYSVFSFHTSYRDSGMFGIYVGTSPEQVGEVVRLVYSICADVAAHGLTAEELRKGKEQVKGSMMLSLESTSSRMSRLGKNELMLGREVPLDETLAGIQAVTEDDVRRVAQQLLTGPFAVAAVGTVGERDLQPH